MIERTKLFIGGDWVGADNPKLIDVVSPSTEEVIGRVPESSGSDVDRAVTAARSALAAWSDLRPSERGAFLSDIAARLRAKSDDIGRMIASEVGMPLKLATRIQAGSPAAIFEMYAKMVHEFEFESEEHNSLILREPVGVVAAITPWNYPLHQIAAKVAPALAAGCVVVLKPSEIAPLNAFILADAIEESGLPAGVFNLVTGTGPVVGEALVRHAAVDMVSFTGSTNAGRRVGALAAEAMKRTALELGGKSASIILDDADLEAAVKSTVNSCFLNSGQTCNAQTRLLVPESMYQQAAELAVMHASAFQVGDPFDAGTKLGPLASGRQQERVLDYIRRGIESGREVLCGGIERPKGLAKGFYVKPTVFGRVEADDAIAQEEIFGPVLCMITYRDEAHAVRIANGTPYGLGGAVWSRDQSRALSVARRLRTGQVDINGAPFNYFAPFGGFGQSGRGRELGKYGLEEYLELKAIQTKRESATH